MGWQHTERLIRLAKIATIEAIILPTQFMKGLVLMSTPAKRKQRQNENQNLLQIRSRCFAYTQCSGSSSGVGCLWMIHTSTMTRSNL